MNNDKQTFQAARQELEAAVEADVREHEESDLQAAMDDKLGIADRLRDSAALIRDQIDGEEGDAVYLDLELLADEIEEMESQIEDEGQPMFTIGDPNDLESQRLDLFKQGVGMLNQAVHTLGTPGKNRQQGNKT